MVEMVEQVNVQVPVTSFTTSVNTVRPPAVAVSVSVVSSNV